MTSIKVILMSLLLFFTPQLFASDCSVGYAHMKSGKYKLAYGEFRDLAERGYPIYMNMIGDMHLKGQGVPKSKMLAYIWYSLAAAQDDATGMTLKKAVATQLSNQQLADSREIARVYAINYLKPYVAGWSLE